MKLTVLAVIGGLCWLSGRELRLRRGGTAVALAVIASLVAIIGWQLGLLP